MSITTEQVYSNSTFNPANNLYPIVLSSDNDEKENFSFLIDMCTDEWLSDNMSVENYNGFNRLKLSASTSHNFVVGDTVYLDSYTGNETYDGKARVLKAPDKNTIIVDKKTDTDPSHNSYVYKLYRNEVKPRPGDGLGSFDGSVITSMLVDESFDPNPTGVTRNYDNFKDIRLYFGETYIQNWDFVNNYYNGGSVAFTGTTTPPFSVGDQVVVSQRDPVYVAAEAIFNENTSQYQGRVRVDGNITQLWTIGDTVNIIDANTSANNTKTTVTDVTYNSNNDNTHIWVAANLSDEDPTPASISFIPPQAYEGHHEVTAVDNNNNLVTIDVGWSYDTPTIPGNIKYAYNNKQVFLEQANVSENFIFDGALTQKNYRNWNSSDYDITPDGNKQKFIATDAPDSEISRLTKDHHLQINFIASPDVYGTGLDYKNVILETTNKNNTNGTYEFPVEKFPDHIEGVYSFHCGPAQLNSVDTNEVTANTGTFPIIKDDTVSYSFYVTDENDDRTSEKHTVKMWDPEHWGDICRDYPIKRLVFKDRLSSYQGYLFNLLTTGEVNYERSTFRNEAEQINPNNNNIDNQSFKRGLTTIYNDQEEVVRLSTGYINETEFDYLRELLDSPEVYLEFWNSEIVPVVINGDSVEMIRNNKRELQEIILEVTISNKEIRQRN